MANTAAYNANEVAAVYMSLNRNDILSTDEGGSKLGADDSLKNGFYGLSDPLNLRGLLESFEVDFSQSSGKGSYKVRILNPTAELETTLIGFYSEVFPSNTSTFTSFKSAWEQERRDIGINDAVGESDQEYTANDSPPQLPTIYLRFGYGTDEQSGLSRIHKAKVFDIKYIVSDKEDKVIELHAVDLFSYSKQNPSFNKRPYMARTEISDIAKDANGKEQLSLRRPADILTQLFAGYLSTYPECIAAVDLGSYTDSINNLVYSVALGLAKADVLAAKNQLLSNEGLEGEAPETVGAQKLTPAQVKSFEDLLDRPLITLLDINREVDGKVTPQILYQAFKMVFEQIGLKWEMRNTNSPEPITGPLSEYQIDAYNTKTQKDITDQNQAVSLDIKINIQSEWLQYPTEAGHTEVISNDIFYDHQKRLSFWSMAFDDGYIRPLTLEEKRAHPEWKVWLNAGMVNYKNYRVGGSVDNSPSYKYSFPYLSLNTKFNAGEVTEAKEALRTGTGKHTIQPIPVCFPAVTSGNQTLWAAAFHTTVVPLRGTQNSVEQVTWNTGNMPLVNIATGEFMRTDQTLRVNGAFRVYADYTQYDQALAVDWDKHLDPPLLNLEPTVDTALWVLKNILSYEDNKQKKQQAIDDQIAKEKEEAEKNLTPEEVKSRRAAEFADEMDKYSNGYVVMGDDGEQPHISGHLSTIINNLNRLIVGKGSKMRVEQVQVNSLSVSEREALTAKCSLFADVTWDEVWADNNNCILLLMPGADMTEQYGDQVIRPVLSFPQTYSVQTGPKYIWLDYGTPDSIIADLDFTGDARVLVNLAQSNFSVRQWNDITQFWDGNETLSEDLVINSISKILANKIENGEYGGGTLEEQAGRKKELEETLKLANNQSESMIDQELIDILPTLLNSFQVDSKKGVDELSEMNILTPNDAAQIRKLASLISNPKHLEMIFPYATTDGKQNTVTSEVLMVSNNNLVKVPAKKTRILRRRIDMDTIRSRISKREREDKMIDSNYNYSVAMQQESFNISITTLGIPEIDDPASEYLSRRVCFKFYDPRLANGSLHWLSGVYQITSFKHRINPSQGFLTELELVKLPNTSLDNIIDTR